MKFSRNTIYGIFASTLLSGALSKPIPQNLDNPEAASNTISQPKTYLITLSDTETRPVAEVAKSMGYNASDLVHVWDEGSFRGFSVKMHKTNALSLMDDNPSVDSMEPDMEMKLSVEKYDKAEYSNLAERAADPAEDAMLDGITKRQDVNAIFLQQQSSPWNLERVSCKETIQPGDRRATDIDYQYRFSASSGQGVDVYMLDTGINVDNVEFEGRAQNLFSVDGDFTDYEGHGSHTSGTVGSRTFGVAKKVNLWNVKVFGSDGSGSLSGTVAGVTAAIQRHNKQKSQPGFMGSVISMSLGALGTSTSMAKVLKTATDAGIHVSVAAGNDGGDACSSTPAQLSTTLPIITVGASTIKDTRASFSNFGRCTNVYAPGTQITSTFNQGKNSVKVLQGTSMACPAVTGLIAYNLVLNPDLRLDPAGMRQKIISSSLSNTITDNLLSGTGTKVLINNGFLGSPASASAT